MGDNNFAVIVLGRVKMRNTVQTCARKSGSEAKRLGVEAMLALLFSRILPLLYFALSTAFSEVDTLEGLVLPVLVECLGLLQILDDG